MSNKIHVKVYADGDFVGEEEFDQGVIKVGRLPSSHLCLDGDGVARMHAVLERNPEGYRLIDLGSYEGSALDGTKIARNTQLPKTGTLTFGSFKVEYRLDEGPETVDFPEEGMSATFRKIENVIDALKDFDAGKDHHFSLAESLIQEMERLESGSVPEAKKMFLRWEALSPDRKRKWLRLLVEEIRSCRKANQVFQRKRIATMLNLGMDGIEAIFALEPEEAMNKAHETILEMALAKNALEALQSMEIADNMRKELKKLPPSEQEKQKDQVNRFLQTHEQLVDRLQTSIIAGGSLLPTYLTRASGHEATDEEREQWRASFEQIEKARAQKASEAN